MTAGTCSLLFPSPCLLFRSLCRSIFNCCSSHLHLFPICFPLITYPPLKAPNLTFLHRVYFSAFTTNLFPFAAWFILLFPMRPCTYLQLLANEPCEPPWFLFLHSTPSSTIFTPLTLPSLQSLTTLSYFLNTRWPLQSPISVSKTLTNRPFTTLCVWKLASVWKLGSVLTPFTQVAAQLSPNFRSGNTYSLKGHVFFPAPCVHFPFCPELKYSTSRHKSSETEWFFFLSSIFAQVFPFSSSARALFLTHQSSLMLTLLHPSSSCHLQ